MDLDAVLRAALQQGGEGGVPAEPEEEEVMEEIMAGGVNESDSRWR